MFTEFKDLSPVNLKIFENTEEDFRYLNSNQIQEKDISRAVQYLKNAYLSDVSLHEKMHGYTYFEPLSSSSFLILSFYRENVLVTQSVSMCFQIGIISSLFKASLSLSLSLSPVPSGK